MGIGGEIPADIAPVIAYAQAQHGKPYVWGGSGPTSSTAPDSLCAHTNPSASTSHTPPHPKPGTATTSTGEPNQYAPATSSSTAAQSPSTTTANVGIAISATHWIIAPKTGDVVSLRPIPFDRIQTVRRLVAANSTT